MNEIVLDGGKWSGPEEFYNSLLPALGAPGWHEHTLQALGESLGSGDENQVNPPLRIVIQGSSSMPEPLRQLLVGLEQVAADLRARGVHLEVALV